jgi:hypothetical protein
MSLTKKLLIAVALSAVAATAWAASGCPMGCC